MAWEQTNGRPGSQNLLNYKNLSFNLFTNSNNVNKIRVHQNTFDAHKLFKGDSKDYGRSAETTRNLGIYPLIRQSNDLGSKVRLNKVKL